MGGTPAQEYGGRLTMPRFKNPHCKVLQRTSDFGLLKIQLQYNLSNPVMR
jgi:hypothetical protein